MLLKSKTLSISICCEPKKVYEFVSNITNLPKWAKTFCRSARKTNEGWIIETPQGPVKIHLAEKNEFGILDHYVSPSPDVEIFVPTVFGGYSGDTSLNWEEEEISDVSPEYPRILCRPFSRLGAVIYLTK